MLRSLVHLMSLSPTSKGRYLDHPNQSVLSTGAGRVDLRVFFFQKIKNPLRNVFHFLTHILYHHPILTLAVFINGFRNLNYNVSKLTFDVP